MAAREMTELEVLMLILQRFTNLPEVYDFLADPEVEALSVDRRFLAFLDRFGGLTLVVPTRERVAQVVRDVHITRAVRQDPCLRNRERLAALFHLDLKTVKQVVKRMERAMEGRPDKVRSAVLSPRMPAHIELPEIDF